MPKRNIEILLIAFVSVVSGCTEIGRSLYQWKNNNEPLYALPKPTTSPDQTPQSKNPDQLLETFFGFDHSLDCEGNQARIWPACRGQYGRSTVELLTGSGTPAKVSGRTMLNRCLETGYQLVVNFCPVGPEGSSAPEPATRLP